MKDYKKYSIEQLENSSWGPPPNDASDLVKRCYLLRKVSIKSLSIQDIRCLLSQNIGARYLLPSVIPILREQPFIEVDFFSGDLLKSVIGLESSFWTQNKDCRKEISDLIRSIDFSRLALLEGDDIFDQLVVLRDKFLAT